MESVDLGVDVVDDDDADVGVLLWCAHGWAFFGWVLARTGSRCRTRVSICAAVVLKAESPTLTLLPVVAGPGVPAGDLDAELVSRQPHRVRVQLLLGMTPALITVTSPAPCRLRSASVIPVVVVVAAVEGAPGVGDQAAVTQQSQVVGDRVPGWPTRGTNSRTHSSLWASAASNCQRTGCPAGRTNAGGCRLDTATA
jgi:hypothetical protein